MKNQITSNIEKSLTGGQQKLLQVKEKVKTELKYLLGKKAYKNVRSLL